MRISLQAENQRRHIRWPKRTASRSLGLQALKNAGVLNWVRRCAASFKEGRFTLVQETNAYAILPSSQWRGFAETPDAPPPAPGTWGDHPCGMRDPMEEATAEQRAGSGLAATVKQLELGERGGLAATLASLGRAIHARNG